MKKYIFRIGSSAVLFSLILLGSQYSCTYNQISPVTNNIALCDTFKGDFKSQILPILQVNCNTASGCHEASSPNGDFATDTNYLSYFISTGDFKKRVFDGIGNVMPPSGFSSATEKDKLKCWFDKGHSLK